MPGIFGDVIDFGYSAVKEKILKGKFVPHRKLYYWRGAPMTEPSTKRQYFLIGSGRKLEGQEARTIVEGGWWRTCPECVKAGGPQEFDFHREDNRRSEAFAPLKNIGGITYDAYNCHPNVLPPGASQVANISGLQPPAGKSQYQDAMTNQAFIQPETRYQPVAYQEAGLFSTKNLPILAGLGFLFFVISTKVK